MRRSLLLLRLFGVIVVFGLGVLDQRVVLVVLVIIVGEFVAVVAHGECGVVVAALLFLDGWFRSVVVWFAVLTLTDCIDLHLKLRPVGLVLALICPAAG